MSGERAREVLRSVCTAAGGPEYGRETVTADHALAAMLAYAAEREAQAHAAGMREAAEVADQYAEINFEMAGDGAVLDPLLHGKEWTAANVATSKKMQLHSTIHASQAHAAQHLAAAIRARITPAGGER